MSCQLLRLLLGVGGLLGASVLQLTAPPLVSSALMAAEKGAKFAQAKSENSKGSRFLERNLWERWSFEHVFFEKSC